MELKQFIDLLKRWYWLLILGVCLGAASGILISRIQEPVYEATAKTLVMRAPDETNSGLGFLGADQLAMTFSQLITTRPVLDEVSAQLGVKVQKTQIQIRMVTNTNIIMVIVDDNDPQVCASIANALVETAIKRFVNIQTELLTASEENIQEQLYAVEIKISDLQSQITQASETILNNQMEQLRVQMAPLQDEISRLQQDIAQITPAITAENKSLLAEKQSRIDQIQPLLTTYLQAYSNLVVLKKPIDTGSVDEDNLIVLEKKLALYQQSYVDITGKLEALNQSQIQDIANVIQIEKASVPVNYVRPQILINTLLTTAAGFILAAIAVFLMDALKSH